MRAAIFFERDGVLNLARVERQQQIAPRCFEEFRLNPDIFGPLDQLQKAGYVLLATTNQPRVSQGILSRRELDLMHELLERKLKLDGVLLCPHDEEDACPCRKPKAGLLTEGAFKWHIDLDRSFVVSDKWQDAQAAHLAGCTSILIKSPWNGTGHHDFIADTLNAAVEKILQLQPSGNLPSNNGTSGLPFTPVQPPRKGKIRSV